VLWFLLLLFSNHNADVLHAIRVVECGDVETPPDGAAGEIGPYQILRPYWEDSGIPGEYEMCREREYSERVVRAYMKRWCPKAWAAGDAETISRVHNGGPRGAEKSSTISYWLKVEEVLQSRHDLHKVDHHQHISQQEKSRCYGGEGGWILGDYGEGKI